jgi:hypothetical protein
VEVFYVAYTVTWASSCLVAGGLFLTNPRAYALVRPEYWRFLAQPWKLVTFAAAMAGLMFVAPYTGDPTWDYFDAAFMSVLAFCTAPWAVGVLYRRLRGETAARRQSFVALCLWLFSASWSYDLYLLTRDGAYPVTWWANLFASSLLYLCAGLFWSLDWQAGRGPTFAFMEPHWLSAPAPAPFRRVLWPALLLMVVVSLFIASFISR